MKVLILFILYLIIIAVVSYLLGCVNGAVIISKYILKKDVRELGSGNAGLTNFYRNFGKHAAIWVILMDVAKSVISCLFAKWLMGYMGLSFIGAELALFFTVLGHMYPVFFEFKGGKGILTCVGGLAVLDWRIIVALLVVFLLVSIISRFVSLGSICAAVAYPIVMAVLHLGLWTMLVAVATSAMIVYKHWPNVERLVKGEEPKFKVKK